AYPARVPAPDGYAQAGIPLAGGSDAQIRDYLVRKPRCQRPGFSGNHGPVGEAWMPLKLDKSDRRLLLCAAAVLLLVIVAIAFFTSSGQDSGIPATDSTHPRGAKAAYLLLEEEGYHVERWNLPPSALPIEAGEHTLVLALPLRSPSREEKEALRMFLYRGGRILATGFTSAQFLPDAEIDPEPLVSPVDKGYQPQLLTSLTRGGTIHMSPGGYWKKASTNHLVHYADEGRPIVVSYKVGKGQAIWWASSM